MNIESGRCALSDLETHIRCGRPEVGRALVNIPDFNGNPDATVKTIPICQKHYDIIKGDTTRELSISSVNDVSMVLRDAANEIGVE